ncbi:hypothetical protein IEQ11_08175 [Lysobacter capsici]|uniref:hypothetical protein n=1 Tax=Lysobacter capsici TaxID=435897 RepID=UPI0017823546|nr:hypothetical protein [Lysobacter capsici]UOF16608.1 hypothetical protein IEQ11_08175 [Lysobacter capsici]
MPEPVHIPPPSKRFRWDRWAPYRNPNGRGPFDPPANSVIYQLKMKGTEVAQIWRQPAPHDLARFYDILEDRERPYYNHAVAKGLNDE